MIADFVNLFFMVLTIAVFIRVLLSWVPNIDPRNPGIAFLFGITEPILAPIRSIMPNLGGLDISPIVLILTTRRVKSSPSIGPRR